MKAYEIDTLFSEKVAEYIASGYRLNPATMSGHQGEIAKIDLTNGKEIVRMILASEYDFEIGCTAVSLTVGVNTNAENLKTKYRDWRTMWNQDCDVIEVYKFYQPDDRKDFYFTSEEDAKKAVAKHFERWQARQKMVSKRFEFDAKYIVKRYIQRKYGYKNPSMTKMCAEKEWVNGKAKYYVWYNGCKYALA